MKNCGQVHCLLKVLSNLKRRESSRNCGWAVTQARSMQAGEEEQLRAEEEERETGGERSTCENVEEGFCLPSHSPPVSPSASPPLLFTSLHPLICFLLPSAPHTCAPPPPPLLSVLICPSFLAGTSCLLLWWRGLLGWLSHCQVFDVGCDWLIHDYCNCSFTPGSKVQKKRASMKDAEESSRLLWREDTPKKVDLRCC